MGRILIPKTSRIPYSTSQIVLAGFIDTNVGVDRTSPITLTKRTAFGYPNEWGNTGDEGYYVFVYRASPNNPNQTWYLMLQQGGEEGFGSVISATNPSTSVLEIPTTGWVLAAGVTGSISITASNRKNISIKKQNQSTLKPYRITDSGVVNSENIYIFKGGSANTISTVFDSSELKSTNLASSSDRIGIFNPNTLAQTIYFYRSGHGWRTTVNITTDVSNNEILLNSLIVIYLDDDIYKEISVGSGAIIQRSNSGKLNAKRNIAAPSGIPTATANSIILQSGENYFLLNGAEFPRQDDGYFGDFGDWKLVWNGTRWEILGDNLYLAYYSLASNQTVNLFPDQGSWFRLADSATVTLVFVGT